MGPIADGRRQLCRQRKVAKRHEVRDRFIPSLSRKRLFIQEMRVPSGHQRKWSGQLNPYTEPRVPDTMGKKTGPPLLLGHTFCLERQRINKQSC